MSRHKETSGNTGDVMRGKRFRDPQNTGMYHYPKHPGARTLYPASEILRISGCTTTLNILAPELLNQPSEVDWSGFCSLTALRVSLVHFGDIWPLHLFPTSHFCILQDETADGLLEASV